MIIQLSELKINPAKYFDFAKRTDVIVTRHGKRPGRIVCEEKAASLKNSGRLSHLSVPGYFLRNMTTLTMTRITNSLVNQIIKRGGCFIETTENAFPTNSIVHEYRK